MKKKCPGIKNFQRPEGRSSLLIKYWLYQVSRRRCFRMVKASERSAITVNSWFSSGLIQHKSLQIWRLHQKLNIVSYNVLGSSRSSQFQQTYLMTYNGWTIRKEKGIGGIFGRSMKVFSLPLGWKSVCPPRTKFFYHGAWGDFFLIIYLGVFFFFRRLPPPNLLSFFLMVTSLN